MTEASQKAVLDAAPEAPPPGQSAEGPQDGTPDYTVLNGPALLAALRDDAMLWATAFRQHALKVSDPLDTGWLVTWFANAIEYSGDVRRWRGQPETRPVTEDWATPSPAGQGEAMHDRNTPERSGTAREAPSNSRPSSGAARLSPELEEIIANVWRRLYSDRYTINERNEAVTALIAALRASAQPTPPAEVTRCKRCGEYVGETAPDGCRDPNCPVAK